MTKKSEVRVQKIWVNTNSDKNQVTVQFCQEVEKDNTVINPLVQAAQGVNFGPQHLTALMSFNREKAIEFFGTDAGEYKESPFNQRPTVEKFEEAVGEAVAISVTENTTQNPLSPTQTPKVNPQTGEVLTYKGAPIFRHTELTLESRSYYNWLQHDTAAIEVKAQPSKEEVVKSASELLV